MKHVPSVLFSSYYMLPTFAKDKVSYGLNLSYLNDVYSCEGLEHTQRVSLVESL